MTDINWGPTGELVYQRTYSRVKPNGEHETWPETVERVVDGNLALVPERYQISNERENLIRLMTEFKILPAGRHLWASGVKNAQHLFNCWVSGWTDKPSDHFEFTFLRLMEGGGVGANYSNRYLSDYPPVQQELYVHIVCDPEHPDFDALFEAGVLSSEYHEDWQGAFVIEDSREGWASALVDLIDTHYRDEVTHYQRVYDVSRVRAAGTKLKTFGGRASGPLPLARMLIDVCEILSDVTHGSEYDGVYHYHGHAQLTGLHAMGIDHAIAQCVVAGGVRRSARMSMMHWEDSQVRQFVNCKQDTGSHWTTNISVVVDEKFWAALRGEKGEWANTIRPNDIDYTNDRGYNSWDGKSSTTTQGWARKVLEALSEGAVRNGEPGMWDSSLSNVGEPNTVVATNPCGEITLEPWEPCNLGHINLAGFVTEAGKTDYLGLINAHKLMTRFLIRATYSEVGDPKSRLVLDRNRRIGVGHLGVASYLALTGRRYSEAPADRGFTAFLRELAGYVDEAAEEFCHELRIPVPVKKRTVAPTGTIAKMPGVSEGIHPIFSRYFNRRIRFSKHDVDQLDRVRDLEIQGYEVEDDLNAADTFVVTIPTKDTLVDAVVEKYGPKAEELVESASDLTLNQMLAFQALYQTCWADNAVSFTANVDPEAYTAGDVAEHLVKFSGLIKGSTLFPEKSYPQAPYERITKEEYESSIAKDVSDGVDEDCGSSCPIR